MKNIKFSILIPVYNVEQYLKQCIDSVLTQNYSNFEIILVDDGSTDSSGIICDEYAAKDRRIRVVHKKNEGLFCARRTAMKEATGDYFLFLDSDDYWEDGLLNAAEGLIEKYSCDMIIFNYKNVFPECVTYNEPVFGNESIFEDANKKKIYQKVLETDLLNHLCLKIVSKNIVDTQTDYSEFYDVSLGEDLLQSAELFVNAAKILYTDKVFYNYRRTTGMTKSLRANYILSETRAREYATKIYSKTGINLKHSINVELYNYLKEFPKYVLYGYLDNPKKLREALDCVFKTEFYKMSKKAEYNKQFLFNKVIIWLAEKGYYKAISIIAYLLKQRNKLKEFINS